ncbi:DUF3488 and transglutaminase-like domain-containing protein [Streptomyces sp. NPDC003077]|uniref:transglutaminase TgpA family protein n=1 Tax=Streptomyces sp. NPDC003077 TaxID=3154443 RepID=UPI0033A26432
MSGRARLTVCAAVATLGTACALLPLVEPMGWIFQAAILLAVVSGVGALARRVPLPRPLTVAAQALVGLLLLTVLFAHRQAVIGVLPGPDVFREFGQLVQEGVADVGRYAIPAPVTEGIRLLLVGGVLVIGLAVDTLAVTYRSAAPAGLPLLALYSVAAGLSQGGAGWLWFLVAAAGYLLLLLAEGRDRLSQWGRVFGGAAPGGDRPAVTGGQSFATASGGGPALAPVRTGRRIGALVLGIALVVPAALPAFGGGLLLPRGEGLGTGANGTISAVNPLVSLQDSLRQPEDREVLNYRTTSADTRDLYLRIVALDQFDGRAWKPSERTVRDVPDRLPTPPGLGPDVDITKINTSISTAEWYAQSWLPLPYPASKVEISGRWRFEPMGRTLVGDRGQSTRGVQYQVESLLVRPTARQLAAAATPPEDFLREYTKVPDSLPGVVHRTALQVTRGARSAYEKAVRLQDWFALEGGFSYNTEVEAGSGTQAIARFLAQKEGFCVHFAFSMAAMARTLGLPARVAVGFTPGIKQPDGTTSVGLRDAHAWPELYFEGIGWTRFEPTPSRGTPPDYTLTDTPSGTAGRGADPLPSSSAAPPAGAAPSPSCAPDQRRVAGCGASPAQSGAHPQDDDAWWWSPATLLAGSLLLLILALASAPMLWRTSARTRRLSPGRHGGDGCAHILAGWRELVDSAWDFGIPPDDTLSPRKAAARIVEAGGLPAPAAEAAHRVATSVEHVLYAPRPQPAPTLVQDVATVRAALRLRASGVRRLRAEVMPRSSIRALWALSAYASSLLERWRTSRTAARTRRAADTLRPSRRQV